MKQPIKIAFIIDSIEAPTGGTEKQLLYLLNGLNIEKVQPHLVCFYQSEWMKKQVFDFPVTYLNLRKFFSPDFLKAKKQFIQLHQQNEFDIVQTFFKDGNIFGTYAGHKAKIRKVISSRRNVGYWHNKLQITILRKLQQWTDFYIANSQAAVDMTAEIEKAPQNKFTIIYNGLDLEKFNQLPQNTRPEQRQKWNIQENDILVGTVANLRPVKRISTVIEAANHLKPAYPNLKFVCIGEGSERPRFEQMIADYGLQDNVLLPGSTTGVLPALTAFDIAVLPSSNESFSNALIEYMAAKLPIAATRVGGNSEAIEHKKNGYLYDLDDKEGLINALKYLIDNKEASALMAEKAKQKAFDQYSIQTMIDNHEQFYKKILV